MMDRLQPIRNGRRNHVSFLKATRAATLTAIKKLPRAITELPNPNPKGEADELDAAAGGVAASFAAIATA